MPFWRGTWLLGACAMVVVAGCGGHGGSGPDFNPPAGGSLQDRRPFRAITGISMGAYGAMNIGTKHADLFSTIAALGGPLDMRQLLRDVVDDNLEVKAQMAIPRNVGDDFTYDHQAPYPGRDTRLSMNKDLVIAFGNPVLHHPDPSRQYLAMDSEPARLLVDDAFESPFGPYPHFRTVAHALFLELEGDAVPKVVADIFLVDQDLMHRSAGPGAAEVRLDAATVQVVSDVLLRPLLFDEVSIDRPDGFELFVRAKREHHAVRLDALVLAAAQVALRIAALIDQPASQAVARSAALAKPEFDETALAGKDLGR